MHIFGLEALGNNPVWEGLVQRAMRVSGPSRDERAARAMEDLLTGATAYSRLSDAFVRSSVWQLLAGSSCDEKYVKAFAQVATAALSRWSCRLCDIRDVYLLMISYRELKDKFIHALHRIPLG